jgi:hypothetical protein
MDGIYGKEAETRHASNKAADASRNSETVRGDTGRLGYDFREKTPRPTWQAAAMDNSYHRTE